MILGTSADGRALTYEHSRYEFRLAKQVITFDDVCTLESRDWIRWRAPELREWFVKIDRDAMIACNKAAAEAALAAERARPKLRYRSTNPSVASVDEAGRVIVRGPGETSIIAARAEDTNFVSAVRLVTIVYEGGPAASTGAPAVGGVCEVRESYKSKGGVLAKKKSFNLPQLPLGASGYQKIAGSECLSVSPAGQVTVAKGTPRGQHAAEVSVCGVDASSAGVTTIIVQVEVK